MLNSTVQCTVLTSSKSRLLSVINYMYSLLHKKNIVIAFSLLWLYLLSTITASLGLWFEIVVWERVEQKLTIRRSGIQIGLVNSHNSSGKSGRGKRWI